MTRWKAPSIGERPILVFGAQVMGRRIACLWVAAGFNVNIQDEDAIERAEAMQYVVGHVAGYMKRIGSTKRGVITTDENLDTANSWNPWLVIEALPEIHPLLRQFNVKVDLLGDLDGSMPDDCLLCMNSLANSKTFLRKVNRPHRVLNLHHYLVPNVRVIEMVQNEHTDPAIVKFLSNIVPDTGALPIIARDEESAMPFQQVWIDFKKGVLDTLDKDRSSEAIDNGWDDILRNASAKDVETWFDNLSKRFDDMIEENYIITLDLGRSPLSHLKKIFSKELKLPFLSPYKGLEVGPRGERLAAKLPRQLQRSGPDIYFVDIGLGDNSKISSPELGRILCNSRDGTVRVLVDHLRLPYGLAIHVATQQIFWSDIADCNISACNLTGESKHIIVPNDGRAAPKQIEIDQIASRIYWTQNEGTQILRSNTDGTCVEVIFETSILSLPNPRSWPNGLSLDPSRRHFYWSQPQPDNEKKFRIFRASMELSPGSNSFQRREIEIVFDDLPEIFDIDFVPVFDEIYWSARKEDTERMVTEIHRGYVGFVKAYSDEKQDIVAGDLKGMGWLKVDPKGGHVYTTCLRGVIARFDMTTGENGFWLHQDKDGAFAGIALIYEEVKHECVDEQEEEAARLE